MLKFCAILYKELELKLIDKEEEEKKLQSMNGAETIHYGIYKYQSSNKWEELNYFELSTHLIIGF